MLYWKVTIAKREMALPLLSTATSAMACRPGGTLGPDSATIEPGAIQPILWPTRRGRPWYTAGSAEGGRVRSNSDCVVVATREELEVRHIKHGIHNILKG